MTQQVLGLAVVMVCLDPKVSGTTSESTPKKLSLNTGLA